MCKCGNVFGAIYKPGAEKLDGLTAVCGLCINKHHKETGKVPTTPEEWDAILGALPPGM
jgi:hypothetical protein